MRTAAILLLIPLILTTASCGEKQIADLILKNGKVITIDRLNPRAQAVAVKGNLILAVGSNGEIEKYLKPGVTKVLDLQGKMVVPGFNDAHIHFFGAGAALEVLNLAGIANYDRMTEKVAARVREAEPGEWVFGRGWDHTTIPGQAWPTKEVIDKVSPDNPVMLHRIDGHSMLVNSVILKQFDITADTPDPPGGTIVRDPSTGEPTGVLQENAMGLVEKPEITPEENRQTKRRQLKLALGQAAECGVTSIHHISGDGEYFEELQQKGELTLRVYLCQRLTDDPARLESYKKLKEKYTVNPLIKFGALKAFMDGTLGSQTAALFEPFSDKPSTSGLLTMPVEKMEKLVLAADREGFQVAIHAIGTQGNHLVLDVCEKVMEVNGKRDSRHRIEHASILIKEDIPRFAELGVIASYQPTFCATDQLFAEDRLGHQRCRYAYAWRSVLSAGGRIAFGTDCAVEPMDPMEGLYAAVSRKDRAGGEDDGWIPEEKLTMEEAIELYTLGSAYASFEENIKGSIEAGKLADMVVLSQDLMQLPENRIMKTEVVYTVFDGRIIYENTGLSGTL
ncbi:amidohydrolase [Gemmatimonadota bacterium]